MSDSPILKTGKGPRLTGPDAPFGPEQCFNQWPSSPTTHRP